MAFYRFARAADDVADHATRRAGARSWRCSAGCEAALTGESDAEPEGGGAAPGAGRARASTDEHVLDLLEAFRRDVTKLRYADWDELMDYCRYSAAPVGRFVLDVHGEAAATWPANDALCAALQVINHLQDCAKDYRDDRPGLPAARRAGGLRRQRRDAGGERRPPGPARGDRRLARRTANAARTLAAVRRRDRATCGWRWRSA